MENALINAVTNCSREDGWSNLAEVGAYLRKHNVRYGKLSKFVASYAHIVETRIDNEIQPPVAYARVLGRE